ncbi:hypothetical protein [Algoriphagus sp.]|uniref:hypothetical protein n=1 Tax=Algoriphagus sp. TaxID=1872435 RepID=UPI0032984F59
MRFAAIALISLLYSTASLAQQNEAEEAIRLSCIESNFASNGIDLLPKLDSIESYLIQTGQLADDSGEAYYSFFKEVGSSRDHFTILPDEMTKIFLNITPADYYTGCQSNFNRGDTTLVINELESELQQIYSQNSSFHADQIALMFTTLLKPKDFDRPYLKTLTLLFIANTSLQETSSLLNQIIQKEDGQEPCIFHSIQLTSTNKWLLNEVEITEENLLNSLKTLLTQNPATFCIYLTYSSQSSYATYSSFNNKITQMYMEEKEKTSTELFKKTYKNLSLSQRITIEKSLPVRMRTEMID